MGRLIATGALPSSVQKAVGAGGVRRGPAGEPGGSVRPGVGRGTSQRGEGVTSRPVLFWQYE
jgi:hypothetical protein